MDEPESGERILQDRLGTTDRADSFYDRQVLDHLNDPMREFLARQDMMFLATCDATGSCDNTFRAGPPGFVRVLDDRRLTWPEYRGNGVMASLGNIVENPHVALLFVDFTEAGVGLHVNGTADIVEDPMMRSRVPGLPVDPVPGRRAQLWVVARVKEAYIHCAKHIPRMIRADRSGPAGKKSDYFVGPESSASSAGERSSAAAATF
jgi:predicted pyridoxine 5'-phosphate oxidase superfamily flavin-nucleotide-binding protein